MKNLLAQGTTIQDIFGKILPPKGTPTTPAPLDALIVILNVGLTLTIAIAGLMTLVNLIYAGYTYLMAGGEAKKLTEAQDRIKWSAVGLLIVVVAPLIAALIGYIVFKDPLAILKPTLTTIK